MYTLRGEEITDEKLADPIYRLDLIESVYNAIVQDNYSDISEATILATVPNRIHLRDALLYLLAKSDDDTMKFLAMCADNMEANWPEEKKRGPLLQTIAAAFLLTNNDELAEASANKAIEVTDDLGTVQLAKLVKYAVGIGKSTDQKGFASSMFKSSIKQLSFEHTIFPETYND